MIELAFPMNVKVSLHDLKEEVSLIRKAHPKLKNDDAFVLWFLRAFLADSEEQALKALTGATGDKSIDAILIDERSRQAHLLQGKFRQSGDSTEKRSDVLALADLSNYPWEQKGVLEAFYSKLDPLVREKFEELVKRVRSGAYQFRLYYVTTGKCSKTISNEAKERASSAEGPVELFVFDSRDILTIFKDYLEGVAPAVPILMLPLASEGPIQNEGAVHRFDPRKGIESWVFTMSAKDVGEMYAKAGIRLFARNIRGYLGNTEINEAMAQTIGSDEADNFWYYNNGVTIVCDDVKREQHEGKDVMRVDKPQVINGQQTTRVLNEALPTRGSVLIRIIKIPRHPGDDEEYDSLVNSIVRATNWQNYITPSDLVSNDYIQVFIERSLRKLGYQYIRKRMTKSEAKRLIGGEWMFQIDKREMAQAVGACEFDPVIVRKGKEGLFEDPYYKSIFSSRSVSYYLPRYWLMRQVQYMARGKPQRAYGKWLVLNFAWELLSSYIESGEAERKFRNSCENYYSNEILTPLHRALDDIFKAALVFFRSERGKGEEAKDISTFFLLTKLDQKFKEFWTSSKNPYRRKVELHIEKFHKALEKFEITE
jgi:hypothetical protein